MNKVKIVLPETDEEKYKAKQLPKDEKTRQAFRKKFNDVSRYIFVFKIDFLEIIITQKYMNVLSGLMVSIF